MATPNKLNLKAAPWKIMPKQRGHRTVASAVRQCSHSLCAGEHGEPQLGQLSDATAGALTSPRSRACS